MSPYSVCSSRLGTVTIPVGPMTPVSNSRGIRKAARAFSSSFSRDGISPVAHISHEVEAALALGWPELSSNGYIVEFPGHYDGAKEIGSFSAGHESLMELPILMGILELEGMVENARA